MSHKRLASAQASPTLNFKNVCGSTLKMTCPNQQRNEGTKGVLFLTIHNTISLPTISLLLQQQPLFEYPIHHADTKEMNSFYSLLILTFYKHTTTRHKAYTNDLPLFSFIYTHTHTRRRKCNIRNTMVYYYVV